MFSGIFTNVRATPAPSLVSPSPNSYVSDNTPLFDWTDVTGNDNYNIQVASDSGFTNFVINAVLTGLNP